MWRACFVRAQSSCREVGVALVQNKSVDVLYDFVALPIQGAGVHVFSVVLLSVLSSTTENTRSKLALFDFHEILKIVLINFAMLIYYM